MTRAIDFVIYRVKPREGWLPLLLLVAIVACLITAVLDVTWIPEDGVVIPAAVGGFLLGSILAKRPLSALAAWILIVLYGVLIAVIGLANLWPTWAALRGGWATLRPFWLQNGALFLDRVISWGTAVFNNQTSQETIVFALGLALISYFLTAFTSWQVFRHYRPFSGLLAMGLGLALNGYFGGGEIWFLAMFVGLTALLTAVMHLTSLTGSWDTRQVDYSDEVRTDLFLYGVSIATILLILALVLPSFSIRRLVQRFQEQPIVQQTEAALERAFGGVEAEGGQPGGRDGVGGSGILPRAFLLGNSPELYETVVMTAVVESEANLRGIHWRALSYDVYTGRGWALSEERTEPFTAGSTLPLPAVEAATTVSQTVNWRQDDRLARYTLGLPLQFDQPVDAIWRGQSDFVRANGAGTVYTVQSRVAQATPDMLRQTAVDDVPPAILARYTALPDEVPQRVLDLAEEVAGNRTNPYDQARALEQFLRQYTYSLEEDPPPGNVDPVDYFLFEQQAGYCDFYASSMVVLARALGLPARIGIGYLAQPADENGFQTMYQINGHSWAEVYFAGFGWVEFEPTAAFPSPHSSQVQAQPPDFANQIPEFDEPESLDLPPVPEVETMTPFPWTQILIVGLLAGGIWWLWRRGQLPTGADAVVWSYGRLQAQATKLGHPPAPSQTPQEFLTAFQNHLHAYGRSPRLAKWIAPIRPHLTRLTNLYIQRRYGGDEESGRITAWESWQQVKRPLWLLRVVRRFANRDA